MNQNTSVYTHNTTVNVSLVVVNVTQIKSRIMINVHVNVNTIKHAKKIIFEILLHIFVKTVSI